MSPYKVQSLLRVMDPDLCLSFSERQRKWVVQKWINELVYSHPLPDHTSDQGVHVLREYKRILRTQFTLAWGLCQRSVDQAKRAMFWKRGVSPNEVADAMDRDDIYNAISKKKDRANFKKAFAEDHGKQLRKKMAGEPTIQAGLQLTK